ncbi:unnamed protein product [Adineta ricciae]|uniref:Aminoglycoside phosphotransferase domain-containing protein n=1 Tax=Adineta ricciae TaxID=249248 RepID=A0A813VGR5_ADIRI|nr:unnamed protein product [Adineta ricciae]CAF1041596.1 unnamed protein product [Adineta ricciae]
MSSQLLERKGPRDGISFTREQAESLIRTHLHETITSFECVDIGYNNLLFFIKTTENRQEYALKIGGRYWIRIKTEAEVRALQLLHEYTTIPVPKVLAYSSDRNNEFGVEWILMTRLPGQNLGDVCSRQTLTTNTKKILIRDLADYVAQMHFKVPRYNQIGAFTLDGRIGTDLNKLGPWSTYEQFIRTRAQSERSVLNTNPVFAPIKDAMLDAIERFERLPFPSFDHLPFVFSHGDLDFHNILVCMDDPDSPRITGIVDWEWAGSFPCSEEYFTSYNTINDDNDKDIQEFFFDELDKRNVLTPRTIQHFSLLKKFDRFVTNLASWYLTDLTNPDDPAVNKSLQECRSTVQSTLEELQNELL